MICKLKTTCNLLNGVIKLKRIRKFNKTKKNI